MLSKYYLLSILEYSAVNSICIAIFRSTPELCGCCGDEALAALRDATSPSEHRAALQAAFTALMLCDAAEVGGCLESYNLSPIEA